jgi:uncharacterized membrane protein YcaP (DUF421 family)
VDPLRIAARAVLGYLFLLLLVRVSGKRTVRQGSTLDFTVALIVGDMVDDLLWAEVNAAMFVVGAGMLFLAHTSIEAVRYRLESGR